jgi:monoamine oxidase
MTKNVAIIGGGISGLYAAWRIARATSDTRIDIFESDSRLGGRIWSQEIPGIPFRAELGAMRFRSTHALFRATLEELRIPVRPFDVKPPQLRVRGRLLSAKELSEERCMRCNAGGPYALKPQERGHSPEDLILDAIGALLKDLSFPYLSHGDAHRVKQRISDGEISDEVWQTIKESGWYDNTPLFKIGFWNLLQHYLSNEAFQLVHDALSLESILGNWSAAEAIPWFVHDFANYEFSMVPGGMHEVIDRLERELVTGCDTGGMSKFDPSRVVIQRNCRVRKLEHQRRKWTVTLDGAGAARRRYDAIIIALPRMALKAVEISSDGAAWNLDRCDDVEPHVMYKMFLLYEREWWMGDDTPGYSVGRTFTDLPLRQVYYFSPNWMQHATTAANRSSLLDRTLGERARPWSLVMASYSDEHYVAFWRPFARGDQSAPYYRPPSTLSMTQEREFRKAVDSIDSRIRATERIVEKVQQQLQEIHGHQVPKPILGLYKDWSVPPFGGGWHTWNVGTKPWTFRGYGTDETPWPRNLYLCGEAYSAEQGWIEGALKTTESVLHEMGVPAPIYDHAFPVPDLLRYIQPPKGYVPVVRDAG